MSTSRRRCLSAWGHSRHAPSFRAPVMNRRRRANGHPRVFSGARDVPRHARGRPFPQRCRHRPVVSHDLPGLLGTAPRGVVSPQRHPHQGQATIHGQNATRLVPSYMEVVLYLTLHMMNGEPENLMLSGRPFPRCRRHRPVVSHRAGRTDETTRSTGSGSAIHSTRFTIFSG